MKTMKCRCGGTLYESNRREANGEVFILYLCDGYRCPRTMLLREVASQAPTKTMSRGELDALQAATQRSV